MALVWVPALLQDLTGGLDRVDVPGETVDQLITELDHRFPGIRARLVEDDRLRPSIAVAVDGQVSPKKLRQRVSPESEVIFLPAMSGGSDALFPALPGPKI